MSFKILLLLIFTTLVFLVSSSIASVGVVLALNSTFDSFERDLINVKKKTLARREFISGDLWGVEVVFVRSPMGKVGNAITAQILLDQYQVNSIMSISPAGGISDRLNIGDLVVATEVYQHDFGTEKPYGFVWGPVPDGTSWDVAGYVKSPRTVKQHPKIVSLGEAQRNKIIDGAVLSGDQFIQSPEKKKWLLKKFNGLAVDMSAAAITQVCYENNMPVYIYRVITDKADLEARPSFEKSTFGYLTSINLQKYFKDELLTINEIIAQDTNY